MVAVNWVVVLGFSAVVGLVKMFDVKNRRRFSVEEQVEKGMLVDIEIDR